MASSKSTMEVEGEITDDIITTVASLIPHNQAAPFAREQLLLTEEEISICEGTYHNTAYNLAMKGLLAWKDNKGSPTVGDLLKKLEALNKISNAISVQCLQVLRQQSKSTAIDSGLLSKLAKSLKRESIEPLLHFLKTYDIAQQQMPVVTPTPDKILRDMIKTWRNKNPKTATITALIELMKSNGEKDLFHPGDVITYLLEELVKQLQHCSSTKNHFGSLRFTVATTKEQLNVSRDKNKILEKEMQQSMKDCASVKATLESTKEKLTRTENEIKIKDEKIQMSITGVGSMSPTLVMVTQDNPRQISVTSYSRSSTAGVVWRSVATVPVWWDDYTSTCTCMGRYLAVCGAVVPPYTQPTQCVLTDCVTGVCVPLPAVPTSGLYAVDLQEHRAALYCIGGAIKKSDTDHIRQSSVYRLQLCTSTNNSSNGSGESAGSKWSQLPSLNHAVAWPIVVGVEQEVYTIGGDERSNNQTHYLQRYSEGGDRWTDMEPTREACNSAWCGAVVQDMCIILYTRTLRSVYDTHTHTWTTHTPHGIRDVKWINVVVCDGDMLVCVTTTDNNMQLYVYNTSTGAHTRVTHVDMKNSFNTIFFHSL